MLIKIFLSVLIINFLFLNLEAQIVSSNNAIENQQDKKGPNELVELVLENGLKVYLNEDHTQTDVLGAVVVRGGAKMDPPESSGTAHYFEHLMFKGTQSLGTIDYNAERPYLDSIRQMYDLLRMDRVDEDFRKKVLKKIDNYSVIAAKYAIPNEFDNILRELGGTDVNAYTNFENIVYHNRFPQQSINQWVELYRDRFEQPVFRLFQSELETVYEEKNMSLDNYSYIFEELYKNFYPKSIYGQRTVIGSAKDLKSPDYSALVPYWKEYYNANNMALVLIGDFNTNEVIGLLQEKFGTWRSGLKAIMPSASEDPFKGHQIVKAKLAPIPLGIMGFRTVMAGHRDEVALDVITKLLTNSSSTGLIDTLVISQDIMAAEVFQDKHYDKGGLFLFYLPKPIIQSIGNAQKKVIAQIQKLKDGNFTDALLKSVIVSMRKDYLKSMENSNFRLSKIIDTYMSEGKWDDVVSYNDAVNKITKDDIILVANKYFGDNYLDFQSKIGFPKKTKLEKPDITPINPANKDAESVEVSKIRQMDYQEIPPSFVNFDEDVVVSDLKNNLHFYFVKNPLNNIFSLNIRIGIGSIENPKLEQLAYYLNNCGTELSTYSEFSNTLQSEGTNILFSTNNDYFNIFIDGFDENMDKALQHLVLLLNMPRDDNKIIKKFLNEQKMELRMMKKDVNSQIAILDEYSLYGNKSSYLNRLSKKEIKSLTIKDYKIMIDELLSTETYVHYVGGMQYESVKEVVATTLPFAKKLRQSNSPYIRKLPTIKQNKLYFLENSKAVQTHIRVETPSKALNAIERMDLAPFNNYFGTGMNSLLFREVREYRALAYGTWGFFTVPYKFDEPGYLKVGMSTQADKTNEAVSLLLNLIDSMPLHEKRIDGLRQYLLRSFNAQMPSFRYRSFVVQRWIMQGYIDDPRRKTYQSYMELSSFNVERFYESNVQGRKRIINIVGDSKRFDLDKIKINNDFKELKLKDILKY